MSNILNELHSRIIPHEGQIKVCQPLFYKEKTDVIFAQCGRKFGKTWTYIYSTARFALTNPEVEVHIVGPSTEQINKVCWRNLKKIIGYNNIKRSVGGLGSSAGFLELYNGSVVFLMGSENFEAANGLTPDLVIYDEFKAFHPYFHVTMEPNRAARNATLMIVGTPPQLDARNREEYIALAEEARASENSYFFRMDSFTNPHVDHETILRDKEKLFKRGDEHVWYREYEARIVNSGKNMIFGMLDAEKHVHRYEDLLSKIRRDQGKLNYFIVHDPGTTSCHAVLLGCINPYTKDIYLMDEIYEKNQANTSISKIIPSVQNKAQRIYPHSSLNRSWVKVYDEAEAWFREEVYYQFDLIYRPTTKRRNKKEDGLSLIKDTLNFNKLHISDKCKELFKEMEQYATDEKGNLPKKYDHLIDCLRYLLSAAQYNFNGKEEIKNKPIDEFKKPRYVSLDQDIYDVNEDLDIYNGFEEEFF